MIQTNFVDMTPGQIPVTYNLSQGDVGRVLAAKLKNKDGDYTPPTGTTVKLQGVKPSGLGFTVEATSVTGNVIVFTSTKQMTDEAGRFPAEIRVIQGTTDLGSANVLMNIEKDPHPKHTTDGSIDELIPTITLLMETAEAYAVGTRSGVPVSSDDPTYQNNAKFYAEALDQAAANAGYMFFDIVDGELIYTRTDNTQVDFELDDGDLYATIDES